MDIQGLV
jgi:hypothetical protein